MRYSKILGIGSYVPPRVWTNSEMASMMETTDEWIQQRTGIKQRHWVDQNTNACTSDLALEAANRALESAQIDKKELNMIILATLSPDHEFPGTACFLQGKMNLPGIPAIDVRQQCTGFLYSLSIADQYIRTGTCKKILIVGAECHSKGLDKSTRGRDVAVLFGDGAGAVVLGCGEEGMYNRDLSQVFSVQLHADGRFAKELWVEEPSLEHPGDRITPERVAEKMTNFYPKMQGKVVFQYAVQKMPEVLLECIAANGFKQSDIDLFVFHQANLRIIEMVTKQLEIPRDKVFNTIDRFGNTTAATIPLGLDEAIKAGKLKPGMMVASAAFGSGFTWASAVMRW